MNEVNKIRGQYVLKALDSKESNKDGKTYMEFIKELENSKFSEEMNKLFKEGELKGKAQVMGFDVEKNKDKEKELKSKRIHRMEKWFELHRKKG
jgi:hypothetical protein